MLNYKLVDILIPDQRFSIGFQTSRLAFAAKRPERSSAEIYGFGLKIQIRRQFCEANAK